MSYPIRFASTLAAAIAPWLGAATLAGEPPSHASPAPTAESISPFAAHNCYSDLGLPLAKRKLATALQAGLRYIEVDVNHNPAAGGFVVTHKSKDPPSQPLLTEFLEPLWRQWRRESGSHLLIIDLKAGRPDAVARDLDAYLRKYRDIVRQFAPDGSLRADRPIGVCLTGSTRLGQAYIDLAVSKGEVLAQRDDGPASKAALKRYLAVAPRRHVSFLTLNWGVIADRSDRPEDYKQWLADVVSGARRNGYTLRVYTLNVIGTTRQDGVLTSGRWDEHWAACVRAGVDMISTDNYALAVEWWREIGSALRPHHPPGGRSDGTH